MIRAGPNYATVILPIRNKSAKTFVQTAIVSSMKEAFWLSAIHTYPNWVKGS